MQHPKSKFIIIGLSLILGLAALQVPLTHIAGSKISFSLFDSFAPAVGGVVGALAGAAVILAVQIINLAFHGSIAVNLLTIVHLLPPVAAAVYFSKKNRLNYIVPLVAIAAFVASPSGRPVWYYSLYWLIPVIGNFWHRKLWARSLGAAFMAHAVGGAFWAYLVPLPKAVWIALIPVVAGERLLFAAGIAVSYIALTNILATLSSYVPTKIEAKYLIRSFLTK
jgi:hypothetical protein